jgi:hypothetical protein
VRNARGATDSVEAIVVMSLEQYAQIVRLDIPTARAALWAHRAVRRARKEIQRGHTIPQRLPNPPRLPVRAERGVTAMLARRQVACLIHAAVWQAWLSAQGAPRDLIIGVTAPGPTFRAHAWLDGDPPCHAQHYHVLLRRAPVA